MGLGGGSVLIIYLTLSRHTEQLTAQEMNLMLFIPCAVISIFLLNKSHYIKWKSALYLILGGLIGVGAGFLIMPFFSPNLIKKLFAVFLIAIGIKELFDRN